MGRLSPPARAQAAPRVGDRRGLCPPRRHPLSEPRVPSMLRKTPNSAAENPYFQKTSCHPWQTPTKTAAYPIFLFRLGSCRHCCITSLPAARPARRAPDSGGCNAVFRLAWCSQKQRHFRPCYTCLAGYAISRLAWCFHCIFRSI